MKRSIKSIHNNNYQITNNTPQYLLDLGFRHDIEERFIYNFPVLRYKKMTVLRGQIVVYSDSKDVRIDVMDNNYNIYTPFYHVECGNYDEIMADINRSILNEFKKLGIKRTNKRGEN